MPATPARKTELLAILLKSYVRKETKWSKIKIAKHSFDFNRSFYLTADFFLELVSGNSCCKIWNSNLIGYLVSIYLASFRWKELRKERKKVSFCRTLLLACWNRFYTQFDMLLSKKHRQSWDYHLVLAKLPSIFCWAGWNAGIYHLRYILHTKTAHSYRL